MLGIVYASALHDTVERRPAKREQIARSERFACSGLPLAARLHPNDCSEASDAECANAELFDISGNPEK
jgi:hypothetical protein